MMPRLYLRLLVFHSVPVPTDASVLLPAILAAPLRRVLTHQHVLLRRDAVSFVHGHLHIALSAGFGRRGCPGQVIAPDLNVIVGELAELVVVHADQLRLL